MNPYNVVARVQYSLSRKCPKKGWEIAERAMTEHELVLITGGKGTITEMYLRSTCISENRVSVQRVEQILE